MRLAAGMRLGDRRWAGEAQSPLVEDLVSYWAFEETSGTRFDSVGDNDLTQHENVGYGVGINGNAANISALAVQYFDNVSKNLNGLTKLSLSLWFAQPASGKSAQNQLFGTSTSDLRLQVQSTDSVYFHFGAANGHTDTNKMGGTSFHHVVAVYDGAGAQNADKLKIWVDGAAETLTFTGTIPTSITASAAGIVVGVNSSFFYATGRLDEMAYYEAALGAAEVALLWNGGAGNFYPFS